MNIPLIVSNNGGLALLCVSDVKPVKVKEECRVKESSSSSEEEEEDDKYEPDLDLEADFPQGKDLLHKF